MKKLKLRLDHLEVTTFAPAGQPGVVGMEDEATLGCASNGFTCRCTQEVDCYPSKYCTGIGCVNTYQDTCMTANNTPC